MPLLSERALPLLSPTRDLLRRFALAWADAAARALPRARADGADECEILLVDGFAGADYPTRCSSIPGVAGAAMRLAGEGRARGLARVVLMEEDPAKLEWLARALGELLPAESLHGDAGPRPALSLVDGLPDGDGTPGSELEGAGSALVVLDPPAAGKLPLALLRAWLHRRSVEVVLRFPSADLRRVARYRGIAFADLPPHVKRTVEGISRFLGDARHEWLYSWVRDLERGVDEAIERLALLHAERLHREGLVTRRVRLPGEDGPEHVLLLTYRPASALLLNRVVHGLREAGALPWPEEPAGMVRYPPRGELALFGAESGCSPARDRLVPRPLLANDLAHRFAGRSVTLDEVLRSYASTDLFAEELRGALLDLRREGRARFRSLGAGSEVAFPGAEARAMHHPSTRKRATGPQDLTLALD